MCSSRYLIDQIYRDIYTSTSAYIYIYIYIYAHMNIHTHIYIQISMNIIDIFCLHIFFWIRSYCRIAFINSRRLRKKQYGNTNGSRRKYVDRKCLLCSTKFVLMKKCCQNIHIYTCEQNTKKEMVKKATFSPFQRKATFES